MKKKIFILILIMIFPFIVNATIRPVDIHGNLNVNGTNIVDKNGNKFQLRGISTHGIYWFPQYVNQDAFNYMRDEWNINAVRLAMYSDPNSGRSNNTYELVKQGVEYATNAGLYVIIDWHVMNGWELNSFKSDSIEFFKQMASLYKDYPNVLYEICNEPAGANWNTIKSYAEEVINEIRKIDNDAIIIVGTPTWSQDVDVVSLNPLSGYSNIIYSLHFYASTHKDNIRNKLTTALNNGLPVLVSEFGLVNADGNGSVDKDSASKWFDLLNQNSIGYFMWNLSNKNEGSAIIKSNVNKTTGWSYDELTEHGKWLVDKLKTYNYPITEPTTTTTTTGTIETTATQQEEQPTTVATTNNDDNNTDKKHNIPLIIIISAVVSSLLTLSSLALHKKIRNKNSNK